MDRNLTIQHKFRNWSQTIILVTAMLVLLAVSSRLLFGSGVWIWILLPVAILMFTLPSISPYWLLNIYRAKLIQPRQSDQLISMLNELSRRAGLANRPALFWIPSQTINAFAVGSRSDSAIAITDGLLRVLTARELMGVLAHEISHIRNNDLRIMTQADLITRLTYSLSLIGIIIILIALPFILSDVISISIWGLLILIFTPSVSALLQLGLSRVREFDADLDAARLTQDPAGLASALSKLEHRQLNILQRLLIPGYRDQQPSILRSHPDTSERVNRLLKLQQQYTEQENLYINRELIHNPYAHHIVRKPGHKFFSGTWR